MKEIQTIEDLLEHYTNLPSPHERQSIERYIKVCYEQALIVHQSNRPKEERHMMILELQRIQNKWKRELAAL